MTEEETTLSERCLAQFQKEFVFQNSSDDLVLPEDSLWFSEPSSSSSSDPRLQILREELNEVKSLLNKLPLDRWHRHTGEQNPAGFVQPRVRTVAAPELLTQAWCKFTECLHRYDLLPPPPPPKGDDEEEEENVKELRSVHLCEAPGAFVSALNYFLKSSRPHRSSWTWWANTLNPYYEGNATSSMINDDRFIYHTLDHWDFGRDETGDILSEANRRHLVRMEESRGKVDLVTADGSIDCQGDPANQEALVGILHQCETALALSVLSPGGCFVLKIFTCFEQRTVCLLYLLACTFERLSVFKPATSKEGNSESYVVCQGFRDNVSAKAADALLQKCSDERWDLFPRSAIPDHFLDQVVACAKFFKEIQCGVILKNLNCFSAEVVVPGGEYELDPSVRSLKNEVTAEYLRRNRISRRLSREDLMVGPDVPKVRCWNLDDRVESGTFEDRASKMARPSEAQMLRERALSFRVRWMKKFRHVEWVTLPNHCLELSIVRGKPFRTVLSSKFCISKVMATYQSIFSLVERDAADEDATGSPGGDQKRRRTDEVEDVILAKLCSMYPEIRDRTRQFHFRSSCPNSLLCVDHASLRSDLRRLTEELLLVERGHHLLLRNLVCLTRVQAAVLRLLAESFEECGFAMPRGDESGIFLSEFKGDAADTVTKLERLVEVLGEEEEEEQLVGSSLKQQQQQVLQVLSLEDVVVEPFYPTLMAYNCLCIKEKSIYLLNTLKDQS